MATVIGDYRLVEDYNYTTGATDIEVFDKDTDDFIGLLNGNKYDIDDISEDALYEAISNDDFDYPPIQ